MEIENPGMELESTANQSDAFLEGWDDDESPVTEEPTNQTEPDDEDTEGESEAETTAENEPAAEGAAADTQTQTPGEDAQGEAEQQTGEPNPAPTWTIKHNGTERVLQASEITADLLQKGMDYDRVRAKYDESKPAMELLGQFARKSNMSVTEYVSYLRTEAMKAAGMSESEAKRAVELEDREAAVAAREAEHAAQAQARATAGARAQADVAEFAKAFPDVYNQAKSDPKVIPQSVWDATKGGKMSLTAAYSQYAVAQAKAEAAAQVKAANERAAATVQNHKNTARSTGSMKSAGNDSKNTDAFLEGFDS